MKFVMTSHSHPIHTQLKRIKRLSDGKLGGYIQYEYNLSQDDDSWVGDNACVFGNSRIYDGAIVGGYTEVTGNSHIFGKNTKILDECLVSNSSVSGVILNGNCRIYNSEIYSDKSEKVILTDLRLESGSSLKMSDKIISTPNSWEYGLLGQSEEHAQKVDLGDVEININSGKMVVIRINE